MRPYLSRPFFAFCVLMFIFLPGHAQWSTNGTNVYYSNGNVGVGITAPVSKFQVYGGNAYLWGLNVGYGTGTAVISTDEGNKPLIFQLGGTEYARIHSNGYFGIGTNNPLGPLQVYGGNAYLWGLNIGYGTSTAVITTDVGNKPISFQLGGTEYARISANGNLLIGQTSQVNTAYKLDVAGTIRTQKMVVNSNGADFIFDSTYRLLSLPAIEKYINEHHHLPGVASARQMQEEGLEVSNSQTMLLSKVEELTLYIIQQNKEIEALKTELKTIKDEIKK